MEDLMLELHYKQKGYIGTKDVTEHAFLGSVLLDTPDSINYHYKNFISTLKQAFKVFSSKSVYDVELTLYRGFNDRMILACQSWSDAEAGVFNVYYYVNVVGNAVTNKIAKKQTIDTFIKVINDYLKENNIVV
jgi:hypothetical protein